MSISGYRAILGGEYLPPSSIDYRLNLVDGDILMRLNVVIPDASKYLPILENNSDGNVTLEKRGDSGWAQVATFSMTTAKIDYSIGGRNSSIGITGQETLTPESHGNLISTKPWTIFSKQADDTYSLGTIPRFDVYPGMWGMYEEGESYEGAPIYNYFQYVQWAQATIFNVVRVAISANNKHESMSLFFKES